MANLHREEHCLGMNGFHPSVRSSRGIAVQINNDPCGVRRLGSRKSQQKYRIDDVTPIKLRRTEEDGKAIK